MVFILDEFVRLMLSVNKFDKLTENYKRKTDFMIL